jgi:hypothetical protein
LRCTALAVAFACANAVHVTVPLASVWFSARRSTCCAGAALRWCSLGLP